MTFETVLSLLVQSVSIAFFSSLVTELVKFTIGDRVKDDNRNLIFNVTAVIAAIVGAFLTAIYLDIEWTNQAIAQLTIMVVYASGLSILGYKSVRKLLTRLSPEEEEEE